jgi:hypothetical protein
MPCRQPTPKRTGSTPSLILEDLCQHIREVARSAAEEIRGGFRDLIVAIASSWTGFACAAESFVVPVGAVSAEASGAARSIASMVANAVKRGVYEVTGKVLQVVRGQRRCRGK